MPRLFYGLIIIFLLLGTTAVCYGQSNPPPPPPVPLKPTKIVGKAEIFYFAAKPDRQEYTLIKTNTTIYTKKQDQHIIEYLAMYASFSVLGQKITEPQQVGLSFSLYSEGPEPKLADEAGRKLTIKADGEMLASGTMQPNQTTSWSVTRRTESASIGVTYTLFSRLTNAKKVSMQLGAIEFELTDAQLEQLRDMQKTIEK